MSSITTETYFEGGKIHMNDRAYGEPISHALSKTSLYLVSKIYMSGAEGC